MGQLPCVLTEADGLELAEAPGEGQQAVVAVVVGSLRSVLADERPYDILLAAARDQNHEDVGLLRQEGPQPTEQVRRVIAVYPVDEMPP